MEVEGKQVVPEADNGGGWVMAKCSGYCWCQSFPHGSVVKNPPANAGDSGDSGLIPGSRRSPGEGNDISLQYSSVEYPMDRGAWRAIVHWVTRVGHDLVTKPTANIYR